MDWFKVGEAFVDPSIREDFERTRLSDLKWQKTPAKLSFAGGFALKEAVREYRIPLISHVTESNTCAPFGLLGVRAVYKNGTREIYFIDNGNELIPIASKQI